MYGTRIMNIGNVSMGGDSGVSGLFGFAVADYLGERNISINQVSDKFILGFVLDPEESPNTVMDSLYWMVSGGFEPEIIVVGFNLMIDNDRLNAVMDCLKETVFDPFGYEELKGVYSERYVFVKKDNTITGNKKTIRFEIVTNNNEGVIDAAMNTFHETFKGLQDYVDNAVIVHTDVPYNGKEFTGNEACVTVDLTAAKQPKECIYRLTDAYADTIKRNPGVLGDVLNSDKREYIKNPDNPHDCDSSDCAACDKTGCKNHID